ncbi:MAG: S-methyl-5-thioribose-1-phosphate isomerase [Euryarchaeota archaeon]|nr:S-methyl-5-thioribose-1-phosphate isomerase [Euryarchaeota archaeon]
MVQDQTWAERLQKAASPEEAARLIRTMEVRGAAKIGRSAALSLARVAESASDDDARKRLSAAGRTLVAARPTAVSLRNAVNLTLDGLPEDDARLRAAVVGRARRYVEASEAARDRIAERMSEEIPDGGTVLTHCHSSLAVACLVATHRSGKKIRVFADETRPWWQGHITTRLLAEAGVDVTLIVDSAAHLILEMEEVDVVVTGADTVTADGALYNKVGTRAVALGAKSLDIPFLVAAESHKFSPYSLDGTYPQIEERDPAEVLSGVEIPGVQVRNPVFDRTAPALVSRFITEEGPVAPADTERFIRERFGTREGWI